MQTLEHRLTIVAPAAIASVVLGACGSSSDDPFVLDTVSADGPSATFIPSEDAPVVNDESIRFRAGVVALVQNLPSDGRTDIVAGFLGFSLPLTPPSADDMNGDECEVSRPVAASHEITASLQDQAIGNIAAGDALVITSPDGTLATLAMTRASGLVGYTGSIDTPLVVGAGGRTLRVLPEDLVLDIPGDQFPMVSVDIPHLEPLNGLAPVPGDSVEAAPAFVWIPSDSVGDWVKIGVTNDRASITCTAVDDGSFSVPAQATGTDEGLAYEWSGEGRVVFVSREVVSRPATGPGTSFLITNTLFDGIVVR